MSHHEIAQSTMSHLFALYNESFQKGRIGDTRMMSVTDILELELTWC